MLEIAETEPLCTRFGLSGFLAENADVGSPEAVGSDSHRGVAVVATHPA